jgi:hypothetical protein
LTDSIGSGIKYYVDSWPDAFKLWAALHRNAQCLHADSTDFQSNDLVRR